ncbi:hypothetical protein DNTS_021830, partial [Danionella cerebrum]
MIFHVCFTVLLLSALISSQLLQTCRLIRSISDLPVLTSAGDITIGALFSLHDTVLDSSMSFTTEPHSTECSGFNYRTFRWMQTMIFAIEEINRSELILTNVTLGYKIYDSCGTHFHSLRTALALMTKNEGGTDMSSCGATVPVVIGDGGSSLSLVVAQFLGIFHVPQVPLSVCSTSCPPGTRKATRPNSPICCFDCVICTAGEISNVTDAVECQKCLPEFWSNLKKDACIPKVVEFLSFSDTMGITLLAVALLGSCFTLAVTLIFALKRHTALVRANNSEMSFLILCSLWLCFLCALAFIGQPTSWSCRLRHTAFGIAFSLCLSCILGKTIVVLMAFRSSLPGSNIMKWFGPLQQRGIIFLCTAVQVVICGTWLCISPPIPRKLMSPESDRIILLCDVGSPLCFSLPCADPEMKKVLQAFYFICASINSTQTYAETDCHLWKELDSSVVHKEGDVVLAGMFPIHSKGVDHEENFTSQPEQRKCRGFNMRVFRWSQAMIFFIEEINRNPTLLPNITLGYRLYDTCGLTALSLKTALSVVSQPLKKNSTAACSSPSIPIIIGDSGSTLSMAISRVLNLFHIPLVSYFASCACLSDKQQFPYFFRTIPSDVHQANALARLVKHFGWTWVGTIGADDAYGRTGIDLFAAAVTKLGVCVAYRVIIPKIPTQQQLQDIVRTIRDSTAGVLVAFAIEEDIKPVVDEIVRQNITGKQWLASEAWVTSTLISTKENYPSLRGTIGFAIRKADITGLKQFLESIQPLGVPHNMFAREFWETQFQCSLNTSFPMPSTIVPVQYNHSCTGMESVQDTHSIYNDVSELRVTYNVHKAVYTVAHALHDLLLCQRENRSGLTQQCPDIRNLQPIQVVEVLKRVSYINLFGDLIHFDGNGDPVGSYDIVNWQRVEDDGPVQYVTVGRFDSSLPTARQLKLDPDTIIWHDKKVPVSVCSASCPSGYRKVRREGEPVCCYDCELCAEGSITNTTDEAECNLCPEDYWSNQHRNSCVPKQVEFLSYLEAFGMVLAALAILGAIAALTVGVIFFLYRDTPLVRANNSELSFLLLISLTLCFMCALTFLGQPSHWACPLRRIAFGLIFALCLSCLLSKTLVVLMAFKATLPGNNTARWFRPPQQRIGWHLCSLAYNSTAISSEEH